MMLASRFIEGVIGRLHKILLSHGELALLLFQGRHLGIAFVADEI
jgi:hypothetical protein